MEKRKLHWIPFALSAVLITLDQITKALIVANIEYGHVGVRLFGDFVQIIHARNTGIAFSIGQGSPEALRIIVFTILPFIAMVLISLYLIMSKEVTIYQRWLLAGIVGGGLGNIIDRAFRPDGVVDFVSVKFFGLFGMERFPTFNVADSSVVVCAILLFLSILFHRSKGKAREQES